MSGTTLLCLMTLCNTFCLGAFGPLLPEIARTNQLADWQLGVVAGAFGFARMAAALPTGWLAGRYLGSMLAASPVLLTAGLLLLGGAGSFLVLVLGRLLMGLAHTLGTVGGLTALLQDNRGPGGSMRLNTFEFAAMIGVLGGLGLVGMLPAWLGWNVSLVIASSPLVLVLALIPALRHRFPDTPARRFDASRQPTAHRLERAPPVVWMMFAIGVVLALAWSSVSQFLIPVRGTREFGLERSGVSGMLMLAQAVDLVALLPVGRLADRLGRVPVIGTVVLVMGLGTVAVGLGSLPWFMAGCAGFGLGMAAWMLPLGVIRDHTRLEVFAWRTGLYRVGVDSATFLGPIGSGLLGEHGAGPFVAVVGIAAIVLGTRLLWAAGH
ncbi:MAG TPA: MFS transporter [Candidatus Limnocylindrales bacterium]|nr:MFS transporter [Candidatus Limnocylindrales bacterium]